MWYINHTMPVKAELYLCTWLKPVTIWSFDRFLWDEYSYKTSFWEYVYCITVVQENAYMQCSTLLCYHCYHSILPFKILMEFQDMCTHTHIYTEPPHRGSSGSCYIHQRITVRLPACGGGITSHRKQRPINPLRLHFYPMTHVVAHMYH